MGTKRVVAMNVLWNWAGVAANMVAGFIVAPFLVGRLGETTYGVWILVGSLTGFFGLLDLGVRNSVGRNLAFHRAQGDRAGLNATLNTAGMILGVAAAVALLGSFCLLFLLDRLFAVPDDQLAGVRLALVLSGAGLAISIPSGLFDATLYAYQRFDVMNAIDIGTVLVRTGLTFALVGAGFGLEVLAAIVLATTAGCAAAKAVVALRTDPELRLGVAHVSAEAARSLLGYSFWSFLISMARILISQTCVLIISAWLSVQLVTTYSIATRLVEYACSLMFLGAGVVAPLATAYYAQQSHDRLEKLFLEGGRYSLALSLFFLTLFVFLGKPLITLWMGPGLEPAAPLLTILALAYFFPMSQCITFSTIIGMGRHKVQACICLVELAVTTTLAVVWVKPFGPAGVCAAVAVGMALSWGVMTLVCGCSLVGVPLWRYVTHAALPGLAAALLPAVGLALMVRWRLPQGWLELFAYGGAYSLCFAAACTLLLAQDRLHPRGAGAVREGFVE